MFMNVNYPQERFPIVYRTTVRDNFRWKHDPEIDIYGKNRYDVIG